MKKGMGVKTASGSVSIFVLVFGVVITIAVSGLVLLAATLFTSSARTESFEKALTVAQSGAEYYRWHLAHDIHDFTDGTGQPGPYIHEMNDPYGNTESTFSLTITPPASGSSIITVRSTGWVNANPDIKRTVTVKYGIPSFTRFAFFNNSNMWFGNKTIIHGPVFSNGGIRMDGDHDSTVESARSTYTCGLETGCDPSETKPGVWGEGGPQELWKTGVKPIDYNSIALDFTSLKNTAQTTGVYLPPSGSYGYHLVFNVNGTVTVTKITDAKKDGGGYSIENGCEDLYQDIKTEVPVGIYQLSEARIIFVEDYAFVEGTVKGNTSVVAAGFPLDISQKNIWILDSIVYAAKDGTNSLGLIAQNDIIFGRRISDTFEINAAMIAYKGKLIRHNYKYDGCMTNASEAVKHQLIIYGTIISNLKSYWTWGTGPGFEGNPTSGFTHRDIIYDSNLFDDPPPFFPSSGEYEFLSWEEE
jgi:hypothetical protein